MSQKIERSVYWKEIKVLISAGDLVKETRPISDQNYANKSSSIC